MLDDVIRLSAYFDQDRTAITLAKFHHRIEEGLLDTRDSESGQKE